MSVAIAFAISSGAAYLIEYIDDTFKSADEVTRILGLPVVGHIAFQDKMPDSGILVKKKPNSIVAEAFRSISLNVDFMEIDQNSKMILITSIGPKEGKSFSAANLAWSIAQNGKRVILMDVDLRRPTVHKILGLPNNRGVSEILQGKATLAESINRVGNAPMGVITSGEFIPNLSGILGSKKMDALLDQLRAQSDITVLDATPIPVTDSKIMATKANFVLLVVRYGHTKKGLARDVVKQLEQVNANVVGVIFNGIPPGKSYYKTYSYYYAPENGKDESTSTKKIPLINRNPFKLKRS
jgi:receptor protein-tyrosine kinase